MKAGILLALLLVSPAFAWMDLAWQYRTPITVNSGSALTDYQLSVTLNTASLVSAGKLRSDCGDLRFANSTDGNLSYWIESGCNTASTKAWVRGRHVPAGASTIFAYYGSPNATGASSGTATFDLFDDFNDNSIDSSKWVKDSPNPGAIDSREANGRLEQYGTMAGTASNTYVRSVATGFQNFVLEYTHNQLSGSGSGNWEDSYYGTLFRITSWSREGSGQFNFNGIGYELINSRRDGYVSYQPSFRLAKFSPFQSISRYASSFSQGTPYRIKVVANGNSLRAYRDDSLLIDVTDSTISGAGGIAFRGYMGDGGGTGSINSYIDDVRVRKYAPTEPTASLQAEELRPAPFSLNIFPSSKATYAIYNETFDLYIYNNQSIADNFTLSCTGTCYYSENPAAASPYQNKSVNVTITSASVSGSMNYTVTATSQANPSNANAVTVSLTVDATRWRGQWIDSYGNGFRYRAPVAISNGGSALADYQASLTLDTASLVSPGKLRADCGDLRFTNGTNEMPYWIESGCNTSATKIWIKAPYVPGGNSTVYAYYGSPSAAGASSGAATFDLFDDFNDNSIDPSKWVKDSPNAGAVDTFERNSRLEQAGTVSLAAYNTYLRTVNTNFQNFIAEFRHNQLSGSGSGNWEDSLSGFMFRMTSYSREGTGQFNFNGNSYELAHARRDGDYGYGSSLKVVKYLSSASYTTVNRYQPAFSQGTQYRIKLIANGNSIRAYRDDALLIDVTDSSIPGAGSLAFRLRLGDGGGTGSINNAFDDIRVRKYASPEPTLALQQEETQSPALFVGVSPSSRTTYPAYPETFQLWVYNNQTIADNFALSCFGCSYSENPVAAAPYQNKSVNVTITSANVSGTTAYAITATSQANASNFASVSASLTVDATRWRGQWNDAYDRGFKYRVPIALNNAGGALADYQVGFTIDTAIPIGLTRMRSDCGDIRITNGTNEMPYWIESGCNTSTTKIWARVPSLPAGNSTIYTYYGNPSAAYDNSLGGNRTFDFFDDFSGDLGKWTFQYPADWSITSGKTLRKSTTTNSIGVRDFPNTDLVMEGLFRTPSAGTQYVGMLTRKNGVLSDDGVNVAALLGGNTAEYGMWKGNAWVSYGSSASILPNAWYAMRLVVHGTNAELYGDPNAKSATTLRVQTTSASLTSGARIGIIGSTYANQEWDDIRVRKYASPEPSALAGGEQSKGYSTLVRRCGAVQPGANVTAYYPPGIVSGNCTSSAYGICVLEINAGTYDLQFRYADGSTAWKNGTAFG